MAFTKTTVLTDESTEIGTDKTIFSTPPDTPLKIIKSRHSSIIVNVRKGIGKIRGVVLMVAIVVLFFVLVGSNENKEIQPVEPESTSQTEIKPKTEPETETNAEPETEYVNKEMLELLDNIDKQISEDNSYEDLKKIILQYCDVADEYNDYKTVSDRIEGVYSQYINKVIDHIEFLNKIEEVYPSIYKQMTIEFEDAIQISRQLSGLGIPIDDCNLMNKKKELAEGYKMRLINNFDETARNLIRQNGVVSRSVLWSLMENANETGLYDDENLDDPLRLRYIAAYTLHIDSELDKLSDAQALVKIYDVLEQTDYNPVLVYYLSVIYNDNGADEWYSQICSILEFDLSYTGEADQINFMYYYNSDDITKGNYATARNKIRNYMENNFEKP